MKKQSSGYTDVPKPIAILQMVWDKLILIGGRMKLIIRNTLIFIVLFLWTGCSSLEPLPKEEQKKIIVLSTIAMIADLVSEIGKEYVTSTTLIKGELDPHSYELVKGDDEKFARADIIFSNGLGLEHGYSLRHNLENNPKNCSLGNTLLQKCPDALVMIDHQYDPHIWMDIALWVHVIDPIVDQLSQLDSVHASEYQLNAMQLKEKMLKADLAAFECIQTIPTEKRYLVTSHKAFNYFAKHYLGIFENKDWQARLEAPEGLAPEAELSTKDLMRVIDYIEKYNIHVLFAESNVNKEALKK